MANDSRAHEDMRLLICLSLEKGSLFFVGKSITTKTQRAEGEAILLSQCLCGL